MPGCKSTISALPVLTYRSTLRAGSRNGRFSPPPDAIDDTIVFLP
jgi:hypothetical protein